MNRLNFNQSVGFPLETNILDEMQKAWTIFNAFGALAGNFTIISGCVTTGTNVSDGVVYINGELLEFKGGVAQTNVIIIETTEALEFEDLNAHDVIYTRYATFGTATAQWPWPDFKRGFETKLISDALALKEDKTTITALTARIVALEARPASNIPIDFIGIWGRPVGEIPVGWIEYVPLRGRMPLGLSTSDPLFDTLLNYGGAKDVQLIAANIPELIVTAANSAGGDSGGGAIATGDATEGAIGTGKTPNGTTKVNILNPYRIVHFIQYKG